MSGYLFSLSEADRAEQCPASQALPRIEGWSEPASRGSVLHDFKTNVKDYGLEEALSRAPDDMREALKQYPLEGLPQDATYSSEVAFAIDLETGQARELGRKLGRKYAEAGAGSLDIVGAGDDFAMLGSTGVLVDDLKTGHGYVTPAKRNLQVGGLAYAACKVWERKWARVELIRQTEDGTRPFFDVAEHDEFDLDEIWLRLERTGRRVLEARADVAAGRDPQMLEGRHCEHCKAFKKCPAKRSLLTALSVNPGATLSERVDRYLELDPARAFRAFREVIMPVVNAVAANLREWAREHAIDLGDGTEYGVRHIQKPVIDGRKTFELLEELYPETDARFAAVEVKTSKAAIRRALRPIAPPRGLGKMHDAVLEAIKQKGGIEMKPGTKLDVHRIGAAVEEEEE